MSNSILSMSLLHLAASALMAAPLTLDESSAGDEEWGYRPQTGVTCEVNPPSFSWRPQEGVVAWEVQCAPAADFATVEYQAAGITMNVHCPPRTFRPGEHVWRYRGADRSDARATHFWCRIHMRPLLIFFLV